MLSGAVPANSEPSYDQPEPSFDLGQLLRRLSKSSSSSEQRAVKSDADDYEYDDGDALVAKMMTSAVLSSVLEAGEAGEDDLPLAYMMVAGGDEVEAQFFRRLFKKARSFLKNSGIGRTIVGNLRNRFCTQG